MRVRLLSAVIASLLYVPNVFAQTPSYSVTDLGVLDGYSSSYATGINNSGQVVGDSIKFDGTRHAFIYSNGVMTDIGTLPGGTFSAAFGINSFGQVTGVADFVDGDHPVLQPNLAQNAFLYSNGVLHDLGSLPGTEAPTVVLNPYPDRWSTAGYAINDTGMIVGASRAQVMVFKDGRMSGLAVNNARWGFDVNNREEIVGLLQHGAPGSPNEIWEAFRYSDGHMKGLGALDGTNFSYATGINDDGVVVGGSLSASGNTHAFRYANEVMTDLGTCNGHVSSAAKGINNQGVIVGGCDTAPFIYQNGVMTDLNTLIAPGPFYLYLATAINDLGQIAGYGFIGGMGHAFLLTPTN